MSLLVGLRLAALVGAVLLASGASAQDAPRKAFRVCQDPNNMPFSNTKGEGIENKIAELFAKDLGLPVEYFSFPQRLAFVRNTLRYKLPGQDFRCDIIMGVPQGFEEGATSTKPYYRSTYALVYVKGKGLDGVTSGEQFLQLDRSKLSNLKIGLYDRSPASAWLNKHNLIELGVAYPIMNADPAQYPGQIVENDLASGKLDGAIVWGPIAGYFAQKVKKPEMVVVPLRSEPGVKFDFQMAMGVRFGEPAWKKQIESLIDKHQPQIETILRSFNVPLLPLQPEAPGADKR